MNHVGSNETLALALGLSQVEVVALRALLASSVEKGSRECGVKEDTGKSCGDVLMEGVVEVSGDCSDEESRKASSESSWSEAVELAVQAGELPSGSGEGQRGVPRSEAKLSSKSSVDGGSVVMPGGVAVSSAVKEVNFFAGDGGEQKSFFGQYVRSGDMKRFKRWLKVRGVAVTGAVGAELALARYSKGSVPSAFVRGSERLAVLAKVGDNAMTLALTDDMYGNGMSVKDVQVKCGSVLSRMALTPVCVRSGLSAFGVFPTGVDVSKSSPAGEMLEAVAGAVYHDLGVPGVKAFMRALQLL